MAGKQTAAQKAAAQNSALNKAMANVQQNLAATSKAITTSIATQSAAATASANKAQAEADALKAQNAELSKTITQIQYQLSQTSANTNTGPTQQSRQNIFDSAVSEMKSWGLIKTDTTGNPDTTSQALIDQIKQLAFADAGTDTVSLALQNSDAYKARFAGNEARKAAGLPVLSPAEYIATEKSYDQILRNAGVPSQFYRGTNEMAKLIGADVSPTELQGRVDLAAKSIQNADPYYVDTLKNFYGLSAGDMIAHVLDPAAAMPLLQQQAQATAIGAEAARQATGISLNYAQQLAAMGVTQSQAQQGFQNIAQQLPGTQALANRYAGYTPEGQVGQELQAATFGTTTEGGETPAQAAQRLKRLQTQEISQFGGSAGADKQAQSLGIGTAQGIS